MIRKAVFLGSILACALAAQELPSLDKVRAWDARRDEWQKPAEVLAALAVRPGSYVADVGAGLGYFTGRLSQAVGVAGRVYAVDVDARVVRFLRNRGGDEAWKNVEVAPAETADPRLPEGRLDAALVALTWHGMEQPAAVLRRVHAALKSGGRVVLLEPTPHDPAIAERQLRDAGFAIRRRTDDFCPDGFQGGANRLWLIVAEK